MKHGGSLYRGGQRCMKRGFNAVELSLKLQMMVEAKRTA